MSSNIGYHTRLCQDNTRKITGGSFGGSLDMETANRLVTVHFTVVVKDSGRAVFVDREGREVTLYISVDAGVTTKGIEALLLWRAERRKKQEEERKRLEEEGNEVETLMSHLTHEEIVRRLKGDLT
jgi:hypothetical protein